MSAAADSSNEVTSTELPIVFVDTGAVAPPVVLRNHEAILKITAEVFPGGLVAVSVELDAEIPGPEYFVINVRTQGEIRELVAKDGEWHHRIWDVVPETASSYRLSLGVE